MTNQELIEKAQKTHPAEWMTIDELRKQTKDEETLRQLHKIQIAKYRDDQSLYERGF